MRNWLVIIKVIIMSTASGFELVEAPASPPDPAAPQIPFTDNEGRFWEGARPLWSGTSEDVRAELCAASTISGLRFHAVVNSPARPNTFSGRNLWRGDCIYISLDARG